MSTPVSISSKPSNLGTDRVPGPWSEVTVAQSSDTEVSKFVFTQDTAVAETVRYGYPTFADRTVVCCSTQSGCPVGCRFCGAGDSFVRSLTTNEIVSQVDYVLADTGTDPTTINKLQIMFMSMGEPMLNLKRVIKAIEILHEKYPNAELLLSTSGPDVDYTPLQEVSARIPKVGLQFSVHESTNEARDLLVPFARKLTLEQIAHEGAAWATATGRQPYFNYCVHEKNGTKADADRLAELFDPTLWRATVSVVCERDETMTAAATRQQVLVKQFLSMMLDHGFDSRMFNPGGQDDVGGGCGQLWFVQQWMKDNPGKARPSAGRKLPVVHAPSEH